MFYNKLSIVFSRSTTTMAYNPLVMELQPLPVYDKPQQECLQQTEHGNSEQSDRREVSKRLKYGSMPPEGLSTDAKVTQWILAPNVKTGVWTR